MEFTKMHGAGNDFIVFEGDTDGDYGALSLKLCHRRFSVGADGLMVTRVVDERTIRMVYYNSDGTRGQMCGNGARCLAYFAYKKGLVRHRDFILETDAGRVEAAILEEDLVEIAMGHPVTDSPFERYFFDEEITVADRSFHMSYILMGVPHVVLELESLDKREVLQLGPRIETMPLFTQKANVNFVKVLDKGHVMIDTWERGAGNTLACGTGALASVYVLNRLGRLEPHVRVDAPGGTLWVRIDPARGVFLQGGAVVAFEGRI
ncbi:MAG: hypothetical protein AVO33_02780 [delta proteobacterium ML8_F1]|nr:MAG: hypothetical protein AVO33_02780 [delta proteobacterium ML8_F1]